MIWIVVARYFLNNLVLISSGRSKPGHLWVTSLMAWQPSRTEPLGFTKRYGFDGGTPTYIRIWTIFWHALNIVVVSTTKTFLSPLVLFPRTSIAIILLARAFSAISIWDTSSSLSEQAAVLASLISDTFISPTSETRLLLNKSILTIIACEVSVQSMAEIWFCCKLFSIFKSKYSFSFTISSVLGNSIVLLRVLNLILLKVTAATYEFQCAENKTLKAAASDCIFVSEVLRPKLCFNSTICLT